MPNYMLDSDTFIRAKDNEYALDVHLRFWQWIDEQVAAGIIASSIMVYGEITDRDDALADWARARKDNGLFLPPSDEAQAVYTTICDWVKLNYKPHKAKLFLAKADPWLIAQAKVEGAAVVTHEKFEPNSWKVKIPNVCKQFDVDWKNIYKVQAELKAKF